MQLESLLTSWSEFETRILALVDKLGLTELGLECDHASLRVNTREAAEQLATGFASLGDVISNNIINGRPILIFKLNKPLRLGPFNVPCIELPYPGSKQYPNDGWEHIELVLPCGATDCDGLEQALIAKSPAMGAVLAGDSPFKVKRSSPQGEAERLPNPTLAFGLDGLTVKVHPHGIEAIVASEQV
ncbi:VOC family protein [Shewanella litorisediminis]|uniref:VOC family protein n=1 Tax=Shewanella litorisediminis TaxID=1173586 RepID=A0ABX7FZD2_9GAMM|nr:VOC family protein [Shewanella litorisediminis]MCL2919570.1 VOC family protein [Shewanella litorisediminis]QRH00394.1 VOC family protein [Shewanella litorisediminis]